MTMAITPSQPPLITTSDNNGGSSFSRETRLLRLLSECKDMSQLKQIHAQALRTTSTHNNPKTLFLYSRILQFSSTVDTDYAFRVFAQVETPNSFMWNTLIRACARSSGLKWKAMALYEAMLKEGDSFPDKYTFPFLLKACAYLFAYREGIQAHAHVAKFGFSSDVYANNSLIHFYASCGSLDLARKLFDEMPERSVVSWNALIDGLVQSGEFEQALSLFRRMQSVFDIDPDGYTLKSVVNACAGLGTLSLGMWAHCYSLRKGISDVNIGSSLIEMYCKCGSLDLAKQVFEALSKRDVTAWNAMILGFAAHGRAESALWCFSRLAESREERLGPNSITFVGALTACSHGGMVDRGREIFDSMARDHGIEPKIEHYGCLVDLISRAGLVDEALDFVEKMPVKPDVVIWRSLLYGAASWRQVELGERLAGEILRSERRGKSGSGVYVLLSRLYASAEMWNDVGLVRKLMEEEGVAKEPGCSLIEVDGVRHEFFSGDTSHPMSGEIYRWLDLIGERVGAMGYSPNYSQAAMVDEGGDKKGESLRVHSERIAVAFGLIKSEPGVTIRIFKNLRVCDDCHSVFKLVSEAFGVEIIMRDRTRFHRFRDGNCSCNDYW